MKSYPPDPIDPRRNGAVLQPVILPNVNTSVWRGVPTPRTSHNVRQVPTPRRSINVALFTARHHVGNRSRRVRSGCRAARADPESALSGVRSPPGRCRPEVRSQVIGLIDIDQNLARTSRLRTRLSGQTNVSTSQRPKSASEPVPKNLRPVATKGEHHHSQGQQHDRSGFGHHRQATVGVQIRHVFHGAGTVSG